MIGIECVDIVRRRTRQAFCASLLVLVAVGCIGLDGIASSARAQTTTLPPLEVEASKPKTRAKQKSAPLAKAPAAPKQVPPHQPAKAETATGHVDGYVAKVSGTGTKTDTPLIEIPQSISVVTADQIKDQGAQSIVQALRYTPGVAVELNGGTSRFDETRVRGFLPVQYLDGMAVPYNQYFGAPRIEPYGLERIEVLKGPASMLYGQNSPGGLLNMVSKRPTDEAQNEIQLQYGSTNRFQTAFDLSGPVGNDKQLLYRLTGVVRDAETVVDYTRDDLFYIAPAFTWRPSADTSFTLLANYGWDKGTFPHQYLPAEGTLLPNPNGRLPLSRFAGEPGWDKFEREQWSVGYAFDHRFDSVWKFSQNVRYASVDTFFRAHRGEGLQADKQTLDRGAYAVDADAGIFTVDNRLQADFATGALRHKVVMGVDYLRQTGDFDFSGAFPQSWKGGTVSPINIYNPVYGAVVPPLSPFQSNHTEQTQLGFYAQDQIKLGGWVLTLGGRQDWVDNSSADHLKSTTVSRDDSAFTGRAGLTYLFANGLAPYISYSTSFQPTAGADGAGLPFKPTTGQQYEAGIKYQPFGGNIFIAAAVFDIVQQNAVTFDQDFVGSQTGEIHVRGFDVELKAKLTRNLDVIASYAYLDSEVTASSDPDQIGRVVELVPPHQASAWAKYTFHEGPLAGLWVGGGARYVGETLGENSSENPLELPGYTLFDAAVSYDLGRLNRSLKGAELSVNVTNLFDKYHVAGYCDLAMCSLGAGRTVLTTLSYKW